MYKSPTASSAASSDTMVPPPNPFALAQPMARQTALTAPQIPQLGSRSPGYSSHSYSHSASPSAASAGLPELHHHDGNGLVMSPTHMSSATLNAQKRAYRQRRKDPSCDACRERKVKCDATETSACSECSSRNHRCQFTKETNRRMSSIKQVQDLQNQIAELTYVNSQLRTQVSDNDPMHVERTDMKRRHSETYAATPPGPRRVSVPVLDNFDHVRNNIREHAQGLFNTPHQHGYSTAEPGSQLPEVPPRAEFAHLSRAYLDTIHDWYPALYWPMFQREVDKVYASRSFEGCSHEWISLFFAVLACGSLQPRPNNSLSPSVLSDGQAMFKIAASTLETWPQKLSITYAQAALMLSIFATENNQRSLGTVWLASAVGIVHELQICPEVDCWSAIDGEMRRRLWWSIYIHDRIMSLETNRPMLINEQDCEISLPSSVDDPYVQSHGTFRSLTKSAHPTGFVAIVHNVRLYAPLYQALKSNVILPHIMQDFDDQIRSKFRLLPAAYQLDSDALLDVRALPTIFSLLSARFHLYRRNLTPSSGPAERNAAYDGCVSAAQDTAKYVSRALHNPSTQGCGKSWAGKVAPIASNSLCLHLWRCVLMLCFRGQYDAAGICLHLSKAIGKRRKINTACGKNIAFFLDRLLDRVRSGLGCIQQLEHDEEMIAYLSADMQSNMEHSWVWAGTDSTIALKPRQGSSPVSMRSSGGDEAMRDALPLRLPSPSASPNGTTEWDDWTRVESMVRQLMDERLHRTTQPPAYYPPPHNPVKRVQLASNARSPSKPSPIPSPAPSSTSRISIANII